MNIVFGMLTVLCAPAQQAHVQLLRDVYKELIEINTTDSSGDTTRAANAMAARLRKAGYPAADVQVLVPPGAAKKGNLVARLRGKGGRKPLLLLGHLDVVEAKREDWKRDPFTLVEENGTFYARGGHEGDHARSSRPAGRSEDHRHPEVRRDDPDHLCRDDARWRARHERAAPEGQQVELTLTHRFGEPLQRVAHGRVRHHGCGALLQDVAVARRERLVLQQQALDLVAHHGRFLGSHRHLAARVEPSSAAWACVIRLG